MATKKKVTPSAGKKRGARTQESGEHDRVPPNPHVNHVPYVAVNDRAPLRPAALGGVPTIPPLQQAAPPPVQPLVVQPMVPPAAHEQVPQIPAVQNAVQPPIQPHVPPVNPVDQLSAHEQHPPLPPVMHGMLPPPQDIPLQPVVLPAAHEQVTQVPLVQHPPIPPVQDAVRPPVQPLVPPEQPVVPPVGNGQVPHIPPVQNGMPPQVQPRVPPVRPGVQPDRRGQVPPIPPVQYAVPPPVQHQVHPGHPAVPPAAHQHVPHNPAVPPAVPPPVQPPAPPMHNSGLPGASLAGPQNVAAAAAAAAVGQSAGYYTLPNGCVFLSKLSEIKISKPSILKEIDESKRCKFIPLTNTYETINDVQRMRGVCIFLVVYHMYKRANVQTMKTKPGDGGSSIERMTFLLDLLAPSGQNMAVIIQNRGTGTIMFDHWPKFRDSGEMGENLPSYRTFGKNLTYTNVHFFVFTAPGALIAIVRPEQVTETLGSGDDAIPIIILRTPPQVFTLRDKVHLPISRYVDTSTRQHAFCIPGVIVDLTLMNWFKSSCHGLFCDSLDMANLDGSICACYTRSDTTSRCVLNLHLCLRPQDGMGEQFYVRNFSSKSFTKFCLKDGSLPGDDDVQILNHFANHETALDQMEELFKFVNENGGWTVLAWSKMGTTKDASQVDDVNQYRKGSISKTECTYHLTKLSPTNKALVNLASYKLGLDQCDLSRG